MDQGYLLLFWVGGGAKSLKISPILGIILTFFKVEGLEKSLRMLQVALTGRVIAAFSVTSTDSDTPWVTLKMINKGNVII